MVIKLTTYEDKIVRISPDRIASYVNENDDTYGTYVFLDNQYGHWVKETPDEIDRLIEDIETVSSSMIKSTEINEGDVVVIKSDMLLSCAAHERIKNGVKKVLGDNNKIIILEDGLDVSILHKSEPHNKVDIGLLPMDEFTKLFEDAYKSGRLDFLS